MQPSDLSHVSVLVHLSPLESIESTTDVFLSFLASNFGHSAILNRRHHHRPVVDVAHVAFDDDLFSYLPVLGNERKVVAERDELSLPSFCSGPPFKEKRSIPDHAEAWLRPGGCLPRGGRGGYRFHPER